MGGLPYDDDTMIYILVCVRVRGGGGHWCQRAAFHMKGGGGGGGQSYPGSGAVDRALSASEEAPNNYGINLLLIIIR